MTVTSGRGGGLAKHWLDNNNPPCTLEGNSWPNLDHQPSTFFPIGGNTLRKLLHPPRGLIPPLVGRPAQGDTHPSRPQAIGKKGVISGLILVVRYRDLYPAHAHLRYVWWWSNHNSSLFPPHGMGGGRDAEPPFAPLPPPVTGGCVGPK